MVIPKMINTQNESTQNLHLNFQRDIAPLLVRKEDKVIWTSSEFGGNYTSYEYLYSYIILST